jgi:hypothetical protein
LLQFLTLQFLKTYQVTANKHKEFLLWAYSCHAFCSSLIYITKSMCKLQTYIKVQSFTTPKLCN